jgi:hypothetical protein
MLKARRTPWKKGVRNLTGGNRATDAAARIVVGKRAGQDRLTKNDEVARTGAVGSGGAELIVVESLDLPTRVENHFDFRPERRV